MWNEIFFILDPNTLLMAFKQTNFYAFFFPNPVGFHNPCLLMDREFRPTTTTVRSLHQDGQKEQGASTTNKGRASTLEKPSLRRRPSTAWSRRVTFVWLQGTRSLGNSNTYRNMSWHKEISYAWASRLRLRSIKFLIWLRPIIWNVLCPSCPG